MAGKKIQETLTKRYLERYLITLTDPKKKFKTPIESNEAKKKIISLYNQLKSLEYALPTSQITVGNFKNYKYNSKP